MQNIQFTLSAVTYSINDFNAKINAAVYITRLEKAADWRLKAGHSRKLNTYCLQKLFYCDSHTIFKKSIEKLAISSGVCKISLDTLPPPKSL